MPTHNYHTLSPQGKKLVDLIRNLNANLISFDSELRPLSIFSHAARVSGSEALTQIQTGHHKAVEGLSKDQIKGYMSVASLLIFDFIEPDWALVKHYNKIKELAQIFIEQLRFAAESMPQRTRIPLFSSLNHDIREQLIKVTSNPQSLREVLSNLFNTYILLQDRNSVRSIKILADFCDSYHIDIESGASNIEKQLTRELSKRALSSASDLPTIEAADTIHQKRRALSF